ncbi:UNVERIFIED_CONTAM: hypothetical protein HDU68_006924 [Siphonaria sp. JEL0065]|nr:hypothetical protein HDU68_006924 [Siphonaria sp. JEL0065]
MRVTSFVNAVTVCTMAVPMFYDPILYNDKLFGYTQYAGDVIAIILGYFIWDTYVSIQSGDFWFIVHGISAFVVFFLGYKPFLFYYGAVFVMYELSTPFLNIHWFFKATYVQAETKRATEFPYKKGVCNFPNTLIIPTKLPLKYHLFNIMQLTAILSFLAASSSTYAFVRRGAPEGSPGTIDCAYVINFPPGADGPSSIKAHFEALNMPYSVRVAVNNKFANFVSIDLEGDCDGGKSLAPIDGAVDYATVQLMNRPEPVIRSASEAKPAPETIHAMTGVNEARKRLGLTGKGINVAVIDTGVHWKHPALGGGFGPGFKVAKGWDFVGDKYTGSAGSKGVPDSDPDDNCNESAHGTHVAGIVAADARNITAEGWVPSVPFSGVAPDASIFAYRVFGCTGFAGDDFISAAVYQAAVDGAHIINLSLGSTPAYHDESASLAIERVTAAGHFVIASAGNSGLSGAFMHGAPGLARSALGIASFDNVVAPATHLTVDGAKFLYAVGGNNGKFIEGQVLDIVVNDLEADVNNIQEDGMKPSKVNAKGKALLIRWGDPAKGGSGARCATAVAAGATACVIYGDTDTLVPIGGSAVIPSLFTTNAAGRAIIASIKSGKTPQVVVSFDLEMATIPTGSTLSDFSSPGLDNELWFKPDIGGVGGHVYSTLSPFGGAAQGFKESYGVMSGTSMSAPYVAGVAALMLQARGTKMSFAEFRAYLQNSASLRNVFGSNDIHSPSYQGAGLVNAFYSASAKTLVMPSAFSLSDSDNIRTNYTFTITNNYKVRNNYYLNGRYAVTVNSWASGDDQTLDKAATTFTNSTPATLKFFGGDGYGGEAWSFNRVILQPGQSANVTFSVTPNRNLNRQLTPVYGGYITIVNDVDDHKITIPWAGVAGSWKKKNIWTRSSPSVVSKWLAPTVARIHPHIKVNNAGATGVYQDLTFNTLAANSNLNATFGAHILAIPGFSSRAGRIEFEYAGNDTAALTRVGVNATSLIYVYNANTQAHQFYNYKPLRRSTYDSNAIFVWNGWAVNSLRTRFVRVPAGPYRIKFFALRNFGVESVPEDYDVVTSQTFNLVY